MSVRGVRGATTVPSDQPEAVLAAVLELLETLLRENPGMCPEDLASAMFTVSADIHSVYPAKAARLLGWTLVPLMCATEIDVPDGLSRCVRVLLHWNTELPQNAIHHVYLHEAVRLRPDLAGSQA